MAPQRPSGKRRKIPGEEFLVTRASSPHWRYDFAIDGHRFRGSCGTADFAAAAAFAGEERDRRWREIRLGERQKPVLTLNDACVRWYEAKGADSVYVQRGQRYFLDRILRILGPETQLAALDNEVIDRLVQALRNGAGVSEGREDHPRAKASPATVNRYLSTLNVVCTYAREVLEAQVGTWQQAKHQLREPEGRERFLDHATAKNLMASIVPHARPLVMFDLLTGLRKGNLTGLRWEDISFDLARAVLVQKGARRHTVPLVPNALTLLAWLEPEPEKRTGHVFVYGRPMVACRCPHCSSHFFRGKQIRDFRRSFKTAARAAGVPDARIHDMRHTVASWVLTESGDLRLTGELLGHRNLQTTMRYAHLLPGRKESVVAAATAAITLEPAKEKAAPPATAAKGAA